MSVALLMALRVQETITEIAALKARQPAEIRKEQQLAERLKELLQPLIDQIVEATGAHGLPGDTGDAALMVGETVEFEQQLVELLAEELGDEAEAAIEQVEDKLEALVGATKALDPEALQNTLRIRRARRAERLQKRRAGARGSGLDAVRPFAQDQKLFETVNRLGNNMLTRFTSRTMDALVAAAEVDLPVEQLRNALGEMLEGELTQLSRHALGDVRNEATVAAEEDLGVEFHQWVSVNDERTRPAHAEVHGEIVRVGEKFSNGWRRPGGVGCRCLLEPVLEQPDAA